MALFKEEIAIRLGIDSKAMSKGLSTAGNQIKKFASTMNGNYDLNRNFNNNYT